MSYWIVKYKQQKAQVKESADRFLLTRTPFRIRCYKYQESTDGFPLTQTTFQIRCSKYQKSIPNLSWVAHHPLILIFIGFFETRNDKIEEKVSEWSFNNFTQI